MPDFIWLPSVPDWQSRASALPADVWPALVELANARLGYAETIRLDRMLLKHFPEAPAGLAAKPVRLAVLGSSTIEHLLPGLRVGALRRGIWLSAYAGAYGQYLQELSGPDSDLHAFKPDIVLLSFDAAHVLEAAQSLDEACGRIRAAWAEVRKLGAAVFQQTVLPVAPPRPRPYLFRY